MRVLVISQYWLPENGVPQRRWAWLTSILRSEGHSVYVVAPIPKSYSRSAAAEGVLSRVKSIWRVTKEEGTNGEIIFRTGRLPGGSSLTSRILGQAAIAVGMTLGVLAGPPEIRKLNPTVVVGTVPAIPVAMVTKLVARKFKIPYIIDLRDAWPDLLKDANSWNESTGRKSIRERLFSKGPLQMLIWITERSLNRIISQASSLIVTSDWFRRELLANPKRGLQNKEIAVIRNVFPPETSAVKRGSRGPRKSLNVIYAGTLGRAQNLSNALLAAQYAADHGAVINLRFVGAGAASENLEKIAKQLTVNVEIVSRHPASELSSHYNWADTALVHLTNWQALENAVPSKTFELMSLGIHITGVVAGEAAELIKRLNAGVVVPLEDYRALGETWLDLYKHPEKLLVGDDARRWVSVERQRRVPETFVQTLQEVSDRARP